MAPKRFAGDESKRLPKGMKEPYRLWFEFLKLALRVPEIKVSPSRYKPWGDVGAEDFDKWWPKKWRELFAEDSPTRVLTKLAEAEDALRDPTVVLVRVSLLESKKRRVKDISDALSGRTLAPSLRAKRPRFSLTSKRSINLKTLRGMLKFCQLYEDNQRDIEATSIAYFNWCRPWNEKVRSRKWKRPLVYEPTFLNRFVQEIDDRKASEKIDGTTNKNTREYDDLRSQARRFLRKGETVLRTVGKGEFPGTIS